MGYYTLFKGRDGQFYWNLRASNHEIICHSEGYASKQGAQRGIDSCRQNAPAAPVRDNTQLVA